MDLGLAGNVALCTAATSGLGLASAVTLAEEGATVAVCGQTPAHVEAAREQLTAAGEGDVLARVADITDADETRAFIEETVERFGGLDHLVTSAGGPPSGPFVDTTDQDWQAAFEMLVMSVVRTTRHALPHLQESNTGSIVAITSRSVTEVIDDLVLSNAVRRAVVGLIQTQAREFAPSVRANVVMPGAHETPRIESLIEAGVERGEFESYEAGLATWADAPLGRVGDPQELGDVVAFLASPRASYVTGATLAVDGGATRS
jgi:glucose 1-dehydrogenase/3-oxoacyl-[acyl-carrier protein] reductase